jgi:hypothetical protein
VSRASLQSGGAGTVTGAVARYLEKKNGIFNL